MLKNKISQTLIDIVLPDLEKSKFISDKFYSESKIAKFNSKR